MTSDRKIENGKDARSSTVGHRTRLGRGFLRMGLDCQIAWPSKERVVKFRGHEIRMMPETETLAPSLIVRAGDGLSREEGRGLLQEFLSALAWVEGGRVTETFSTFSTGAPVGVGKGSGGMICDGPIEYLPDPPGRQAKLALALYREASSVNTVPYAFLGFAKIINVLHGSGRDQIDWIDRTVSQLESKDAVSRLAEIRTDHSDVGEYLYGSGRCAVAHAHGDTVVNPDDPADMIRLSEDLPVMRALAEYAIENDLGVRSKSTFWEEHLYELEGFRELFGPKVVESLKTKKAVLPDDLPLPERLSLRHHPEERLPSFEDMLAAIEQVSDGIVVLRLATKDELLTCRVLLHFPDERLTFDALAHIRVLDDDTDASLARQIDCLRYVRGWLCNGINEVWDSSSDRRLGRSDPVMLVNMRPNIDAIDAQIGELESRLAASEPDEDLQ